MDRFAGWQSARHPGSAPLEPYIASTPAIAMVTFLTEMRLRYGSARDYLIGQGLTSQEMDVLRATLIDDEPGTPGQA
jgi:hypothetical protein